MIPKFDLPPFVSRTEKIGIEPDPGQRVFLLEGHFQRKRLILVDPEECPGCSGPGMFVLPFLGDTHVAGFKEWNFPPENGRCVFAHGCPKRSFSGRIMASSCRFTSLKNQGEAEILLSARSDFTISTSLLILQKDLNKDNK